MQNYKEDIYINLAYRVGCACFPVFSICYHRSEIWSWSAVIISFSCITLGIMRWVSIRWFGREKLSNAPPAFSYRRTSCSPLLFSFIHFDFPLSDCPRRGQHINPVWHCRTIYHIGNSSIYR